MIVICCIYNFIKLRMVKSMHYMYIITMLYSLVCKTDCLVHLLNNLMCVCVYEEKMIQLLLMMQSCAKN